MLSLTTYIDAAHHEQAERALAAQSEANEHFARGSELGAASEQRVARIEGIASRAPESRPHGITRLRCALLRQGHSILCCARCESCSPGLAVVHDSGDVFKRLWPLRSSKTLTIR